jgi:hypothetical protein
VKLGNMVKKKHPVRSGKEEYKKGKIKKEKKRKTKNED